jgi:hypothetical protein
VAVREDPLADREDLDPVQVVLAADRADQEDLVGFRVVPVVPVVQVVREDAAVEEEVAGVLQAVEHLTPHKSLK